MRDIGRIALTLAGLVALSSLVWGTVTASPQTLVFKSASPLGTQTTATATAAATATTCTGWSVVASPNMGAFDNELYGAAAVAANDVWAVGYWVNQSNRQQTLIEHWNGTAWSIVPSPNMGAGHNVLHKVAALAADDIWAVGFWTIGTTLPQTLIEHWDGSSWTIVPSPNQGAGANNLYGVAVLAPNDVWAVGDVIVNSIYDTLILHWDGTVWSIVPSPSPGAGNDHLRSVAALASNDIWTTGESCTSIPCNSSLPLAEHWDGSSWSVVSSPDTGFVRNIFSGVARERAMIYGP